MGSQVFLNNFIYQIAVVIINFINFINFAANIIHFLLMKEYHYYLTKFFILLLLVQLFLNINLTNSCYLLTIIKINFIPFII